MDEEFEEFILNFFRKLKCNIADDNGGYIISKIPKSFIDLIYREEPLKISFEKKEGYELVKKNSEIAHAIEKYLDNAGKTTLLKIDFDINPEDEIKKNLNLKNCEINSIERKHKNNFFARFSFLSIFNYLNEREQILNEIYVHDGEVVSGDLSGYKVIDGNSMEAQVENVKEYYELAKEELKIILNEKTNEISDNLSENLDKEEKRISDYYDIRLSELGGDISKQLNRISELELEMRASDGNEKNELKNKIDKLKKSLVKIGDDDAKERILREKEFSLKNVKQKFSLSITNKLINTTVIYYPVYTFKLLLKPEIGRGKHDSQFTSHYIDVSFNPLTKKFGGINCDSCGKKIKDINLCSSGHVVCKECLESCGECGKMFCKKCLTKECFVCGKKLCNDCYKRCPKCGKYVCPNCTRTDCVTGEEICMNCLRACSRCHGLTQEKYFGISKDSSKICLKCLAEENRNKIMKNIFD